MAAMDVLFFEWVVTIAAYTLCSLILTFLCYYHGKKYYQDVFTEERASLYFRVERGRELPLRTTQYKKAELYTFLNVLASTFHCYALVLNTVLPQLFPTDSVCLFTLFLESSIAFPKLFLYYALTYRLDVVYKDTHYGFPEWVLRYVRYILLLYMIFMLISNDYFGLVVGFRKPDEKPWIFFFDKAHNGVYVCDARGIPAWFVIFWVFFDVAVTCGFVILFVRPIRALVRRINKNSKASSSKKTHLSDKVISYGKQIAILCSVISTSTIIFSFLWAVPNINLFSVDDLINTIALLLMTPYYPQTTYYQRLCKLCIFCCDRKGITIRGNVLEKQLAQATEIEQKIESKRSKRVNVSIATRSAQRVIANATVETKEYNLLLKLDGYSDNELKYLGDVSPTSPTMQSPTSPASPGSALNATDANKPAPSSFSLAADKASSVAAGVAGKSVSPEIVFQDDNE